MISFALAYLYCTRSGVIIVDRITIFPVGTEHGGHAANKISSVVSGES